VLRHFMIEGLRDSDSRRTVETDRDVERHGAAVVAGKVGAGCGRRNIRQLGSSDITSHCATERNADVIVLYRKIFHRVRKICENRLLTSFVLLSVCPSVLIE